MVRTLYTYYSRTETYNDARDICNNHRSTSLYKICTSTHHEVEETHTHNKGTHTTNTDLTRKSCRFPELDQTTKEWHSLDQIDTVEAKTTKKARSTRSLSPITMHEEHQQQQQQQSSKPWSSSSSSSSSSSIYINLEHAILITRKHTKMIEQVAEKGGRRAKNETGKKDMRHCYRR
jgi:hypothetical protein